MHSSPSINYIKLLWQSITVERKPPTRIGDVKGLDYICEATLSLWS